MSHELGSGVSVNGLRAAGILWVLASSRRFVISLGVHNQIFAINVVSQRVNSVLSERNSYCNFGVVRRHERGL